MPVLQLQEIEQLAHRGLSASGANAHHARTVAQSIAQAEAEGIRNVGLAYLPTYCAHLRCGKIHGDAHASWRKTAPSALLVDADAGFSHTAFMDALPDFLTMVRSQGVAVMSIHNSYSAGVLGWFIRRLALEGLVNLAFANASAMMAPIGGNQAVFGTNPLGFGAPRPRNATGDDVGSLVLDMSSTATARVNVIEAANQGGPIPAGWAMNLAGLPTTDPKEALEGLMAPAAGHKGYGLALIVEILAAGLGGANWSNQASSLLDDTGGPPGVGQCFIAIDPAAFAPGFDARMFQLMQAIEVQEGARVPGTGRHSHMNAAITSGVEVDAPLLKRLTQYALPVNGTSPDA
jgi:(2R)-3-sulfolactate dehydrogenase (NADP+)